jgi:energy-coupling factor transporter ATP-binding protein EcfA2
MLFEFEPEDLKEEIRKELSEIEPTYVPGNDTIDEAAHKTFTGIIGPFGVGKTTITEIISQLKPTISPINTVTTRPRKHGEDPAGFRTADEGISFEMFRKAVKEQALINFSVIPGGDIYGTFPEDFPGEFNMGPFLPGSIKHIENAGFHNKHFAYIVTPGEVWRGFVEKSRRHMPESRFQSRVNETLDSTSFALLHPEKLSFVENNIEGNGAWKPAQEIQNLTLKGIPPSISLEKAMQYLVEIQSQAKDLTLH